MPHPSSTGDRKYTFIPKSVPATIEYIISDQPAFSPFGELGAPTSTGTASTERTASDETGKIRKAPKNGGSTTAGADGEDAKSIIESIGRDFVKLREKGRSQAWAELEDRLMVNAHILIAAGMMSPKDWVALAIDIEQFRRQEQGSQVAAGDWLSNWLSGDDEPKITSPTLENLPAGPIKPKRGRPRAKEKE